MNDLVLKNENDVMIALKNSIYPGAKDESIKLVLSELKGEELDQWVAKALGFEVVEMEINKELGQFEKYGIRKPGYAGVWVLPMYSGSWHDGGPLIEKYGIELHKIDYNEWVASYWQSILSHSYAKGATPLIAAMRCLVAIKFGKDVNDGLL